MTDPTGLAKTETTPKAGEPRSSGVGQVTTGEVSQDRQLSTLKAYNDFLSRELTSIELERDALRGDLRKISHSFGWKLIEKYREWLDSMLWHHNRIAEPLERMASWVLRQVTRTGPSDDDQRYQIWVAAHRLTPDQIDQINAEIDVLPYKPVISVLLQVDSHADRRWLEASISSVIAQLYRGWELRIITRGQIEGGIAGKLDAFTNADHRIRVEPFSPSAQIAVTHGEYVAFVDQRGELEPHALFEVVRWLNRRGMGDLFFSDEDMLDADGRRTQPFFKPGWNPDLLLSLNYLGPFLVLSQGLIRKLGSPSFDRDHRYDLALRAAEQTDKIVHLRSVLYHGRAVPSSYASSSDELGVRAIEQALNRRGKQGSVEISRPGYYSVRYVISGNPLVSIVIPTKNKYQLLRQCLDSIDNMTEYKNYEIVVLDNGSTDPRTLSYLKEVSNKIKVEPYPYTFNFSAINNFGAKATRGEFLLFLNNDTEVIRPDWMTAMLEQAQRPEVGAVGAMLLFKDGRIQHAGVVVGIGRLAAHTFRLKPPQSPGYMRLEETIRDCSAVTAACMMMRRSVFDELGGFDENLPLEFNDVDLCLRLGQRGYLVVYTPRALLYHHESASRGSRRSAHDSAFFQQRWGAYIRAGDPYYNPNLTVDNEDWSVAI